MREGDGFGFVAVCLRCSESLRRFAPRQKVKQVQHLFLRKEFSRGSPIETLTWTIVDQIFDLSDLFIGDRREITALGEEETNSIIDVFVGAALPRLMRLCKIDLSMKLLLQPVIVGELRPIVQADAPNRQAFHHSGYGG